MASTPPAGVGSGSSLMMLGRQPAIRSSMAYALLAIVLFLQIAHLVVLTLPGSHITASNVLQLLCGVTAVWVCLSQIQFAPEPAGRRCWWAVAVAFSFWSGAQAIYLLTLHFPAYRHTAGRLDDLLWTLFGLPLLLAINTFTEQTTDRVLWLDRLQGLLFFAVLYLAVFLPTPGLNIDASFLIQDVALVLTCLLRLPTAHTERERRFFLRLGLFLGVYAPLTMAGDYLHLHGFPPGGFVDLVWTIPSTFFCVLVLWHAIRPWRLQSRSRMITAVRSLQGVNAALLSLLSIGVALYLAMKAPITGWLCIALAFSIFALRTNVRELAWYTAHGQLEETVLRDALTGVGNRVLLRRTLNEWLLQEHPDVVLIFVDLDHFKAINDGLGHALGDELLVEVASRLRLAAPPDAVTCRLGGDEFTILTHARSESDAQAAGERVRHALCLPLSLGSHHLRCTASVGVVRAEVGESVDDLLRTADHAMYRAKQLGKNRVQFFDTALRTQLSNRWHMETELRAAVEAGKIQVAFQPIYAVEEAGVCGFEALARWSHPVLGNVPPLDFIALAEDTGLILALGSQVLEKACAQMSSWNRAWGTELSVSVNVSPRQFTDAGLISSVLAILDRTGLPPSLLRLEITETALLTQESVVKQTLLQARAHGIRISLDDFGTGYSSLSFLLSLPVDEVKVDRSFVSHMHADPDREKLVRSVVRLGHSLGKRVVAEGVETEQDLLGLAEMGCECVQGYLISKPLLPEAMEAGFASIATRARTAPSTPGLQRAVAEPPFAAGSSQTETGFAETSRLDPLVVEPQLSWQT